MHAAGLCWGAVGLTRGGGNCLVNRRELGSPDPPLMAPQGCDQHQVRQAPNLHNNTRLQRQKKKLDRWKGSPALET